MIWNSASEFFAMGGYGVYVWGAYAVTAACFVVEPILARRRHAQARRDSRDRRDGGDDRDGRDSHEVSPR